MNGGTVAQNPMAMNGFGVGGFSGGFQPATNNGASGYAPGGNMFDPFGANQTMNGIGQQHSQMTQMMSQMTNIIMMMTQMLMMKTMQSMVSSMANFGGGSSGGTGISDFLGGSSGGSSAVGGSSAPAATSSDFGSVPGWGAALAKDAEKHAVTGPGGWCFKYVRQALERAGVKGVGGASAYMAADQLAKNPKFREIKVAPKDLPKLPAGAVVVWDRNGSGASAAGRQHGHISISLGDGREVSDLVRKQTTGMGSNVRVFLPV